MSNQRPEDPVKLDELYYAAARIQQILDDAAAGDRGGQYWDDRAADMRSITAALSTPPASQGEDTVTREELRLNAYYYSFEPTGVRAIDMILSAVACAGKAYHHTEDWNNQSQRPPLEGWTPVEWIQNAANTAAASLTSPASQDGTREALAAYAHEAWAGWMRHLFAACVAHQDGTRTIPRWAVERWARQAGTPYAALPPGDRESDRKEADRMLAIMRPAPPRPSETPIEATRQDQEGR